MSGFAEIEKPKGEERKSKIQDSKFAGSPDDPMARSLIHPMMRWLDDPITQSPDEPVTRWPNNLCFGLWRYLKCTNMNGHG
jgi:hypothetical protein